MNWIGSLPATWRQRHPEIIGRLNDFLQRASAHRAEALWLDSPLRHHRFLDNLSADYQVSMTKTDQVTRGYYFTPALLCDFMLGFALQEGDERILEPGCGTGVFLARAYDALKALRTQENIDCLRLLYGVELDPLAAAISFYQLHPSDGNQDFIVEESALPQVWQGDYLSPLPDDYSKFDVIVGNPPYVRQEYLSQNGKLRKNSIREWLAAAYSDYLCQYPGQRSLFGPKGDLYLWFFLRSTLLLNAGGKLVFVTSNSWLNTDIGRLFQRFLCHHYWIQAVIESSCEQWFKTAAVNPVILVLKRYEQKEGLDASLGNLSGIEDLPASFIRLKYPLDGLMPLASTGCDYWLKVRSLCQQLLTGESQAGIEVRKYSQRQLLGESSMGIRVNWSFLLRSPKIIDTLFECQGKGFRSLQELGKIRYPLKTGINRFFYVTPEVIQRFGIEPEFLLPVVKTSKMIKRYQISEKELELALFSCPHSLETLKKTGKVGALRYIEWGSSQVSQPRQKRMQPIPWPEIPSVQGRVHWYTINPLDPPDILSLRFFDKRFFFVLCEGRLMEDQTFYGISLDENDWNHKVLVSALLNSTLSYFWVEYLGRTNLGDGVLQYALDDMMHFPVMDPRLLSQGSRQCLLEAFQSMLHREIRPLEDEFEQADRCQLDEVILGTLFANPNEVRKCLVSHLYERIVERRSLSSGRRSRT